MKLTHIKTTSDKDNFFFDFLVTNLSGKTPQKKIKLKVKRALHLRRDLVEAHSKNVLVIPSLAPGEVIKAKLTISKASLPKGITRFYFGLFKDPFSWLSTVYEEIKND